MKCIVFVDESGDTGIKRIRSDGVAGSSPYFVIGAAVMPRAVQLHAKRVLEEFEAQIPPKKKWTHATDLSHQQMVFLCRSLASLNARYFAVISNKRTLGAYSGQIEWDPHQFYNKCLKYLMEQVCGYLELKGMATESPDVILEERNHNYDSMRRYFGKIKENPMHRKAVRLRVLNPFAMSTRTKAEEPLLKVADAVSHAVYQCTNKTDSNFGIPEPRYLEELQKRMGSDENGRVINVGIKCIHSLRELELDKDIEDKLSRLRGLPMQRSRPVD